MGQAGRPPKPTAIKILEGNPGRRPLNLAEPRFVHGRLTCPTWLCPLAKREWRRVIKAMPDGLATEGDRAALAAYCQAWGRWQEAEEAISRDGLTYRKPILDKTGWPLKSPDGEPYYRIVTNPTVAIAQQYHRLMMAAAGQFGMTPSSRSKVHADTGENEPSFAEMLFSDALSSQDG